MKIGFPVQKKNSKFELKLDKNLHNCKYFGVFNTNKETIKVYPINSIVNVEQEISLIDFLKEQQISNIITPQCHSMAAKLFQNNEIEIYKALGLHVHSNINLLLNSKLDRFNVNNILQNKTCSSECDSCSGTCNENIQEVVAI